MVTKNIDNKEIDKNMKKFIDYFDFSAERVFQGGHRVINKVKHEISRYLVKIRKWEMGVRNSKGQPCVIVSLTSYPKRFSKLDLCIKSLCLQSVKPDRIILWLGNDSSDDELNDLSRKCAKYGLEIQRDAEKNLYSHKKYYYAMQQFADDIIVTADDDLIYPRNWLKSLLEEYKAYPDCICARRVHEIVWNTDGTPARYVEWKGEAEVTEPSHNLLATTGAGTLFPPHCFASQCFVEEVFMEKAMTADDIWLKIMAVVSGRKVVWVPNKMQMPTTVDVNQTERLENVNCDGGGNDKIFMTLLHHFNLNYDHFMKN